LPAFAVTAFFPECGTIRREENITMRSGCAEKRNGSGDVETMDHPDYGTKTPRFEFLKNSINIDKFTGFFDKFLKMIQLQLTVIQRVICKSQCIALKFSGKKSFRLPRISPQLPAFAPAHRTGDEDFGAASRYVGAGRPGISIPPRTHNCELEPPSRFMASRTPSPPFDSGRTRNS